MDKGWLFSFIPPYSYQQHPNIFLWWKIDEYNQDVRTLLRVVYGVRRVQQYKIL